MGGKFRRKSTRPTSPSWHLDLLNTGERRGQLRANLLQEGIASWLANGCCESPTKKGLVNNGQSSILSHFLNTFCAFRKMLILPVYDSIH